MKNVLLIAVFAGLGWTMPVTAADEHHPAQPKAGSTAQASSGKNTPQKKDANSGSAATQKSAEMMGNMEKMQDQMKKIHATTDPKVRQKLMHEHMQSMHESMKAMHDMSGAKADGGQSGKMAMGHGKNMHGGDMMKHHAMMEKRMDMMQAMMEQMMEHQHAQEMAPK